MSALPPYTPGTEDFVFPDSNPATADQGDPFAAEKNHLPPPTNDAAAIQAAAEKVRTDQIAAYEQARQQAQRQSVANQQEAAMAQHQAQQQASMGTVDVDDDGKHDGFNPNPAPTRTPGAGGISRLTVT